MTTITQSNHVALSELVERLEKEVQKKQKSHDKMLERAGELQYEISCIETNLYHLKRELKEVK